MDINIRILGIENLIIGDEIPVVSQPVTRTVIPIPRAPVIATADEDYIWVWKFYWRCRWRCFHFFDFVNKDCCCSICKRK